MKNKTGISLLMALLMVVSTFTVVGGVEICCEKGEIDFCKEVWDGEEWVETVEAEVGETVEFKITLTYHKHPDNPEPWTLHTIKIKDHIPECLDYDSLISITTTGASLIDYTEAVSGKWVYWNFTLDKPELADGDSLIIKFNATVIESQEIENKNIAYVTAKEDCTYWHDGEDDAWVIVVECGEPDVDIEKYVWDEELDDWTEGPATAYEGDTLTFKLNVTNTGDVVLHNVFVTDVIPDFFDNGGTDGLNIGNLNPDQFWETTFASTVVDIDEVLTDDNYANVTADEDVYDEDSVTVTVKPHFILEKQVCNGTEWSDYLGSVRLGQTVKFKITATYYGEDVMKCLVIWDFLPETCLEYIDNERIWIDDVEIFPEDEDDMWPDIYVGEGETIIICDNIEAELPEGIIVWDWRNVDFGLSNRESVVIEFSTNVTQYCEECEEECQCPPCQDPCVNPNCAGGLIWGCLQCNPCHGYKDWDCACVRCCPPPTTFTKKVWDGEEWVDEGFGVVGQEMEFKLEFEYYGNDVLTDLRFKDVLPCVLEFSEVIESSINISEWVSEDKKTIWFNMSEDNTVEDCDVVIIRFTALVTGVTGDCCPDPAKNKVWLYIYECTGQPIGEYYDEVCLTTRENVPPCPPEIKDDAEGAVGEEISFTVETGDYNGDDVYYYIYWGDGTDNGWIGPYTSGDEIEVTHEWASEGEYTVKAKAKDIWGAESDWGNEITVTIEGEAPPDLCVSIKRGFGLKINIKNNKGTDVDDVDWNVTVTKRITGKEIFQDNDTIDTILAGQKKPILLKPKGFGLIKIKVEVNAPGIDPIVKEAKGIICLGFVWVKFI